MPSHEEKYYAWEFSTRASEKHPPPELARVKDLEDLDFQWGEPITADVPPVDFIVHPKRTLLDYPFNIPGLPLFSAALREALADQEIDNVQYFAARFVTKGRKVVRDDYRIANVVGTVECFDWDRSKYDETYKAQGVPGYIDHLVLDRGKIDGQRLFRMAEAPRILLVADSVRRALESRGITGIQFTEIDEYEG